MRHHLLAVAMLAALAGSAVAQSVAELSDEALLDRVAAATEAKDADALLDAMGEVRARGLLMFAGPQVCEVPVPDTPFWENEFFAGAAEKAYLVEAREAAMAAGSCGCVYEALPFEGFFEKTFGKAPTELIDADYGRVRSYRRSDWSVVEERYGNFREERCGDD
jgi:hypothetical protein